MFEEILGIPAHPLIVHAAVVFVPLQVLGAIVYGFLPGLRSRTGWAVVALSVLGPLTAFVAKQSGEAFQQRLVRNGLTDAGFLGRIVQHSDYAQSAMLAALALGVLTLVFMVVSRRPAPPAAADGSSSSTGSVILGWVLRLGMLAAAGATAYYIFKTGDSGAHLVWQGQ